MFVFFDPGERTRHHFFQWSKQLEKNNVAKYTKMYEDDGGEVYFSWTRDEAI